MTPWRLGAAERMARFGEIAIACTLLLITLPLMIVVGLAIKLESPGPVFDRETGTASGGRRFQRLKFRTTILGENRRWAQVPTRIGQFLQYSRIERLPELINVVRGEISIMNTAFFD